MLQGPVTAHLLSVSWHFDELYKKVSRVKQESFVVILFISNTLLILLSLSLYLPSYFYEIWIFLKAKGCVLKAHA